MEVFNDGSLHQQRAVDKNDSHPLSAEIDQLITERSDHRSNERWKEADQIKMLLLREPYFVEIFDRNDGVTLWRKVDEMTGSVVKRVVWSGIARRMSDSTLGGTTWISHSERMKCGVAIPLVIATVDVPHYRARLQDTLEHLSNVAGQGGYFSPIKAVDMLDLRKHPSLGAKRIIYEGWRQVMLPYLLESFQSSITPESGFCSDDGYILVAEDDIRLSEGTSPDRIRDVCRRVFDADPDIHVLSLGHAWSPAKPSRRQRRRQRRQYFNIDTAESTNGKARRKSQEQCPPTLLQHLQRGGGVHATTLLAIRTPDGIQSLLGAMNGVAQEGKKTHFDQFLFNSTLHNVGVTMSDPPVVGWAEVSETLTSAKPGQRNGGGRLEYLPPSQGSPEDDNVDIRWVRRELRTCY